MSINKRTKKLFTKDKRLKFFAESNNQNFVNKNHSNKFLLNNAKFSKVKDFNSITKTSSSDQNSSSNLNLIKKNNKKEITLKEIRQYCLLDTNLNNELKNKKLHDCLKHLAKEFLQNCKQSLDETEFEYLISKLVNIEETKLSDKVFVKNLTDDLFKIIKRNNQLKLNFCAFLSSENALVYNLFMQSLQYEKTNEFIEIIETFISNKCSMKRFLQSIISTCSSNLPITNDNNFLKQCQHYQQQQIINEIKTKVKSSTKNNPLVSHNLDYLFDQQFTNIKPQYESVHLIKEIPNIDSLNDDLLLYEHVDLSKDSSIANNGTKNCNCECHQINTNSNGENDNLLQTIFNHCILCSIKLIKGKLCIKCEGKKAIPLNYKLTNNSSNSANT
jgi:hypothetical protein